MVVLGSVYESAFFFLFTLLYITCIKKNVLLTFLILYFACFLNPVDDYSQNYIFCNYILLQNEFLKSYRFLFCTIQSIQDHIHVQDMVLKFASTLSNVYNSSIVNRRQDTNNVKKCASISISKLKPFFFYIVQNLNTWTPSPSTPITIVVAVWYIHSTPFSLYFMFQYNIYSPVLICL